MKGWVAITPEGVTDWDTLAIEHFGESAKTAAGNIYGGNSVALAQAQKEGWRVVEIILMASASKLPLTINDC
jgi:hypothetical protein